MSDLNFKANINFEQGIDAVNDFFDNYEKRGKKAITSVNKVFSDANTKQEVELVYTVDKNSLNVAAQGVDKTRSSATKLKDVWDSFNGELADTPRILKRQIRELKHLRNNTKIYKEGTEQVSDAWLKVNKRIKEATDKLAKAQQAGSGGFLGLGEGLVQKLTVANLAANAIQATFNKLGQSIAFVVRSGLEFEQLNLTLEGFLGSASRADEAMKSFIKTAVESPLNLKQVAEGGKVLLAFGLSADEATDAVDKLAKIAGATGSDLTLLSRNLGQIKSQGRAFTRDLQQFGTAGIPIFRELAIVIGTTEAAVRDMATEGQIGFDQVYEAISRMTREGSAFSEIAKRMQETWSGRIEAMVSTVQQFSADVFDVFNNIDKGLGGPISKTFQYIGQVISDLGNTIKQLEPVLVGIGGAIQGLALAAIPAIVFKITGALAALIFKLGIVATKIWAVYTAQLALIGLKNPFVAGALLLGTALTGVATALVRYEKQAEEAKKSVERLMEIQDALTDSTAEVKFGEETQKLIDLKKKYRELGDQILQLMEKRDKMRFMGMDTTNIDEAIKNISRVSLDTSIEIKKLLKELEEQYGVTFRKGAEKIEVANQELEKQRKLVDRLSKQQEYEQERLEKARESAKGLKQAITEFYQTEQRLIQESMNNLREKNRLEKQAYQEAKQAMTERHRKEQQMLRETFSAITRNIDAQIGALNARTPAEEKLRNIKKKELQEQLKSNDLTAKETLQIEAQLERMEREEQIAKLQAERKKIQLSQEKSIAEQKQRQTDEVKKLDKQESIREERVKRNLQVLKDKQEELKGLKEGQLRQLDRIINKDKIILSSQGEINGAIADAALKVYDWNTQLSNTVGLLDRAQRKLDAMEIDLKSNAFQQEITRQGAQRTREQEAEERLAPNRYERRTRRAAGGPVLGGTPYTVNELGKEAFLSAAGRLSMINAPAWGKWTAPSSGTVIPAHLTKQLDIPQGGVNLNGQPNFDQRKSGRNPLNSILSALSGAGSDNIQNNVTVQSMNPTKTASDMLVQLTKLRRRRMY